MMKPFYDAKPQFAELHDIAWDLAFKNIERPQKDGWKTQMCCMPGVGKIWQWDSCFMAFYAFYSNGAISPMNNLDNLYSLQREDGFISMGYWIESGLPAFDERINPPLFAWVEWEYYRFSGDNSRFEHIFLILEKYYLWIKNNRRREGSGLYYFEDTGSSGMDNSPRGGWQSTNLQGSDICHVDLICQQLLSAECLKKIAEQLGLGNKKDFFSAETIELKCLINKHHWCEKTGFYYDVFARGGYYADKDLPHCFVPCKSVAAFWTLISGAASPAQADALEKHLLNPEEFYTVHPIPSISRDDPNYSASGMYWCGGVWAPTNYMIIEGLKKYDKFDSARDLALKHIDAMSQTFITYAPHTIWECYSPEFMKPSDREDAPCVRPDFVGWSGIGPIALFVNTLIGLEFDAPNNTVCWHINKTCRNGVENLFFKGKSTSFVYTPDASPEVILPVDIKCIIK